MKMKFLFFCLFFVQLNFGQKLFIDKVVTPLQKSQLSFEKVFIHYNKSTYNTNDVIWFKAYVALNNNTPSLKTTLLYVNLLNETGNLVSSQSILIHNGVGNGQFDIGSGLQPGKYFIQAYTNYMKNFGAKNYFLKEITCYGSSTKETKSTINKYDIQLFPEGGHLLSGVVNNLAIKALINSNSAVFTGEIIDSKNNVITYFKSKYLGMTNSKFLYKKGENYVAKIHINDSIINIPVPKAKNEGVSINVNNNHKSTLKIYFKSTESSKNNKYILLLHQKNKLINFYTLGRTNSLIDPITINKNSFFNGVNTVTLFENNKPISERNFFIEKENKKSIIKFYKQKEDTDSITYKLKILDSELSPLKTKISISVLQATKEAYKQQTDIESAFLLSPYIKGYIENPSYYFNRENPERLAHLDLLLLTQGWAQYSLNKMISNLNPTKKFNFELGFKIKGNVSPLLSNHLGLISTKNKLIDTVFLNGQKEFTFKKLLFYKGDTVRFSFLNKSNTALYPKNINIDTPKPFTFPSIAFLTKKIISQNTTTALYYDPKRIKLDEVEVKGKQRSKVSIIRKKIRRKHKVILPTTVLKISDKKKPKPLRYYLDRRAQIRLGARGRGMTNALIHENKRAYLFVNGKYIYSYLLNKSLSIMSNNIETIAIQETNNGRKIVHVYTTQNYKNGITELFEKYIIKNGYDNAKKYYAPFFDNENSKLVELDWRPNLETNQHGEVIFKVLNKKMYSILFSVQGFSDNGVLINKLEHY